ncbi:MAG TPA: hypothetical protein VNU44_14510 [Bryobacteraceae bacterium]|nr:hypothetical protein [Bryobacteraceae bacterium]
MRELPAKVAQPVMRADVKLPPDSAAPPEYVKQAELDIVVQDAIRCDAWIGTAWAALWRESDILYQALRYTSGFEGSQVAAPNISRFTVAKLVNAVVPQIMKALFYQDPPFLLNGYAGTAAETLKAKMSVLGFVLREPDAQGRTFRSEVQKGWESCAIFGTQLYVRGWNESVKRVKKYKRKGQPATAETPLGQLKTHTAESAEWEIEGGPDGVEKRWSRPFLRWLDHRYALMDPGWEEPDARAAEYRMVRRYLTFDQLDDLRDEPGYEIPPRQELIDLFFPPAEQTATPGTAETSTAGLTTGWGGTMHAMPRYEDSSADPLNHPLEVLEREDGDKVIVVLQRKLVIKSGANELNGHSSMLSSNWWNVPSSGWGMGAGRIVGQDQRVDTGVTNAMLKILSFAVNPDYIRGSDVDVLTQNIRSRLGGVIASAKDPKNAFVLKEQPKVPAECIWALQNSKSESESAMGADQEMIQGTTPGQGRSSLGRTAAGATGKFRAAATRLEGPLEQFIEKVFVPYLQFADEMINDRMPSDQLVEIVRKELGPDFKFDEEEYRNTEIKSYEALAGAHLAAQSAMAQILPLLIELVSQPSVLQQMSEVNGEYMDFDRIVRAIMDMAGWRYEPFIKKMTDEMKQRMAQRAGSPAAKTQEQMKLADQKGRIASEQIDQKAQARVAEKLIVQGVLPEAEAPETDTGPVM